ncbi:3194_t:CDS:2 [Ambispora gerdemannii]|uniref:3194_t:CDS:1 n=1 Tax=Ambispora gerdemannii TaxID=144530 RepID=A0A9N8YQ27_9GLOM|nr:3194_t:CDS:2 [Ambispora gerdemannii]
MSFHSQMQKEKPDSGTSKFTRTTRSDTNHSFTFTEDGEKNRTITEITPSLIVRPRATGGGNYHSPSHVYDPTIYISPNDLSTLSVLSTTTNATEAASVIANVSIVQRIERSTQVTKVIMDNQTGNVDYSKLRRMIERSSDAETESAVLPEKLSKSIPTKNNSEPEPSTNLQTQTRENTELKITSVVKPQSNIRDNNDLQKESTITTMLKSAENNNAVPISSIDFQETIEDIENKNASQSQIYEELSNNLKELNTPILINPDEQDSASISSNRSQSKVQDTEYKNNIEPQINVNEEPIHDFKV